MREKFAGSVFLLFLLSTIATAQECPCPSSCTCDSSKTSCQGITSSPCVQSSTTELVIKDSPNLNSLSIQGPALIQLTVVNTGIRTIDGNFLDHLPKLQTLSLLANIELTSVDLTNKAASHPLSSLTINNSTNMVSVPRLEDCEKLMRLDLSSCGILRVEESDLEDLSQLQYLDLSHNHDLSKIDREAFEDLNSLEEIHFDHCDLTTLYSDYFETAYHKGTLKKVTGTRNPYRCTSLCDFIRWSDNHWQFWSYSVFGTCRIDYAYSTSFYAIYGLSDYNAGCPTPLGIILGITFGAIFFLCILGCVIAVFCGIDWRKYCCFCCESQRNRNNAESVTRTVDAERGENEYATVSYDAGAEKAGLNALGTGMYAAAPPSYEDITKAEDETHLANPTNEVSSSTA